MTSVAAAEINKYCACSMISTVYELSLQYCVECMVLVSPAICDAWHGRDDVAGALQKSNIEEDPVSDDGEMRSADMQR